VTTIAPELPATAAPADVPTGTASPPPAAPQLPFWLRPPASRKPKKPRPTPRQARWWVGVVWLVLSVLLLGFVAHVALFGVVQHARNQAAGYDELRTSLAKAETPLGQLDVHENLVAPGTPIALISIPRIGLNEVVRQGTSSDVTRLGVGHRRDTPMPGQSGTSILFGRQSAYGGPFGQLSALIPGDTIQVTTGQETHTFIVFGLRRPGDPLPQALKAGNGRIELVTADGPPLAPDGVLYVDASLKGTPSETPATVLTERALDPDEQVMATSQNGWLPLLFIFQWLAVASVLTRWLLQKWGRWQTWIVAAPVLLILGATTADCAMALLPNLI
jgi:LPXTG-site transpeptidase (sortase) family protein